MGTKTVITKEFASDLVAISAEHTAQGDGRLGAPYQNDSIPGSVVQAAIAKAADVTLVTWSVASELWVRSTEHGTLAVYLHPEAEKVAAAKAAS